MCRLGRDDQQPDWPLQSVLMPVLGPATAGMQEVWHTDRPAQDGRFQDIHYRRTGGLLFGVITLDEGQFAMQDGATALQALAESAYRQLFALLDAQHCPHLWRVWNYIPRINVEEHGMERYRQFNIGRHLAFAGSQRPVHGSPAACALGTASGPVSIAFLAASSPAQPIENPRQVSAFAYPQQYGPVSPTFSRAAQPAWRTMAVHFRHRQHHRPSHRACGRCGRPNRRNLCQYRHPAGTGQPSAAAPALHPGRAGLPGVSAMPPTIPPCARRCRRAWAMTAAWYMCRQISAVPTCWWKSKHRAAAET
jgi:hypothetical protein